MVIVVNDAILLARGIDPGKVHTELHCIENVFACQ